MNPLDFPEGMTKEQKVYRLTVELQEAKQRKKEDAAAHRDNIKDIESEITAVIAEDDLKNN